MKIKTYNAEKIGQSNKKVVLNMIRLYPGISRHDLAEAVGLDPSTVTKIIGDLRKRGWVREVGIDGRFHPGRPAIKLEAVKDAAVSLVIEMAIQRTCTGLGYLDNSVDSFSYFQTPESKAVDVYFDALAQHLQSHFRQEDLNRLESVSISVPGIVEWGSNILRNVPHMEWRDVDLAGELYKRLPRLRERGADILAANEAKLGLMAEMSVNKALEGMKNGVYIYITQGVGGALMIGEEIYHGSNNIAGELGHMIVCPDGPRCHCGNKGCLETYLSIDAAVKAYESKYHPLGGDFRGAFYTMMKMAEDGDRKAVSILDGMADYMAIGIVNLVNTYDPDFVMLGGVGSRFPNHFVSGVSQRVYARLLLPLENKLKIMKGSMDIDRLALRGTALMAMNEFVRKSFS